MIELHAENLKTGFFFINIHYLADALSVIMSEFMESVCINCKHFVKGSFFSTTNIWGDCRKSANDTGQTGSEIKGLFKWGDATCPDFKPKQQAGPPP